jgi:DNA-binding phage protein
MTVQNNFQAAQRYDQLLAQNSANRAQDLDENHGDHAQASAAQAQTQSDTLEAKAQQGLVSSEALYQALNPDANNKFLDFTLQQAQNGSNMFDEQQFTRVQQDLGFAQTINDAYKAQFGRDADGQGLASNLKDLHEFMVQHPDASAEQIQAHLTQTLQASQEYLDQSAAKAAPTASVSGTSVASGSASVSGSYVAPANAQTGGGPNGNGTLETSPAYSSSATVPGAAF